MKNPRITVDEFKSILQLENNNNYVVEIKDLMELLQSTNRNEAENNGVSYDGLIIFHIKDLNSLDKPTVDILINLALNHIEIARRETLLKLDSSNKVTSNEYKEAQRRTIVYNNLLDGTGLGNYLDKFDYNISEIENSIEQVEKKQEFLSKAVDWATESGFDNLEHYIMDIVNEEFRELNSKEKERVQMSILTRAFYRVSTAVFNLDLNHCNNLITISAWLPLFRNDNRLDRLKEEAFDIIGSENKDLKTVILDYVYHINNRETEFT